MKETEANTILLMSPSFEDTAQDVLYSYRKDAKGFNELRFYESEIIIDWPDGITFFCRGEQVMDLIIGEPHYWVVSERVRQVFVQNDYIGVQFLPIRLVHDLTSKDYGLFWALNVYQETKTFKLDDVKNFDIFRLGTMIFVSNRVVENLNNAKATKGIVFRRVPIE